MWDGSRQSTWIERPQRRIASPLEVEAHIWRRFSHRSDSRMGTPASTRSGPTTRKPVSRVFGRDCDYIEQYDAAAQCLRMREAQSRTAQRPAFQVSPEKRREMRRIYFRLHNVQSAREIFDELLLRRIEWQHIHCSRAPPCNWKTSRKRRLRNAVICFPRSHEARGRAVSLACWPASSQWPFLRLG